MPCRWQIRGRRPELSVGHYWLAFLVVAGAAYPGQPPEVPAASAQSAVDARVPVSRSPAQAKDTPAGKAQSTSRPDEDLMEFLGADDVGDAAWELLKPTAPGRAERPPPPRQDASS